LEAAVEKNANVMNEGLNYACELSKKLQNRGTGKKIDLYNIKPKEYIKLTDIVHRKKSKRRPKLTIKEKIMIVHKVIHEHHSEMEVAKEYRITRQYVSYLCMKTTRNPKYFLNIKRRLPPRRMPSRSLMTSSSLGGMLKAQRN